jgi:hypothetical protein
MKVYMLVRDYGMWEPEEVLALFSTKEKAKAYVEKYEIPDTRIEEKELDPE